MKRIQILEDYFATYEGVFDKNEVGFGCRDTIRVGEER